MERRLRPGFTVPHSVARAISAILAFAQTLPDRPTKQEIAEAYRSKSGAFSAFISRHEWGAAPHQGNPWVEAALQTDQRRLVVRELSRSSTRPSAKRTARAWSTRSPT